MLLSRICQDDGWVMIAVASYLGEFAFALNASTSDSRVLHDTSSPLSNHRQAVADMYEEAKVYFACDYSVDRSSA
tara:strand:+ start:11814 stop:12038 length:225 start_codon:yes stop_codon:yes gene_type:complete